MKGSVFSGGFAVCLTLMAAAEHATAHACTPSGPCVAGEFFPKDGATIPANAPALLWRTPMHRQPTGGPFRRPELQLHRVDGTPREAISFSVEEAGTGIAWIRPAGLVTGARYRLETTPAECTTSAVEFHAGPEAALPSTLGSSHVSGDRRGQLDVFTSSGTCYAPLPVSLADVSLEYAAEAEPWQALLQFRTRVDGKPWRPSSSRPTEPPSTHVYADCSMPSDAIYGIADRDRGLATGEHQLAIEAELPGAGVLQTPETTFRLECGPAVAGKRPEFAAASCSGVTRSATGSEHALLVVLGAVLALHHRRRAAFNRSARRARLRR